MVEIRTLVPSQEPASDVEAIVSRLLEGGVAEPRSAEEVADYVTHCASSQYEGFRALVAEEAGEPLGWLGVMPWPGGYATLHSMRWAPIGWPSVVPSRGEEPLGLELLAAAERAVPNDDRALIVSIKRGAEVDETRVALLRARYAKVGYRFADLVHFIHPTAVADFPSHVPDELTVQPLREIGEEKLVACIRDVFEGPASPFFCGGAEEDQKTFLRALPDSPAMDEPASVVLCDGAEPIGFASTIGYRDNGNLLIDWMGIRPAWRRRGYAKCLLRHVLSTAAAEGYKTASLSSDSGNGAAMALYESQGWEIEGGERQFVKLLG